MAYERFVKINGKKYGPYVYKSVRDENGNVKNIYVGRGGNGPEDREKKQPKKAKEPALSFPRRFFRLNLSGGGVLGRLASLRPSRTNATINSKKDKL